MKAVRPIMNAMGPIEAPPDSYFGNIADLFQKIQGMDAILQDPQTTSVRLVTNPEKMVLRETQRAFVYFCLHGLTVDQVIVNRVLPEGISDPFFEGRRKTQAGILSEIENFFSPIPVTTVPLFNQEVMGVPGLQTLSDGLYRKTDDPSLVVRTERAYSFTAVDGHYEVRLRMPFVQKGEIGLFKKSDELVIEVGTLRRHVGLPTTMAAMVPVKARMEQDVLVVEMRSPT